MASPSPIARVLSIAGSDSGGGAGISADLKAFAHCGVYGMTAITAVTAQNTVAVTAIQQIEPTTIEAQIEAVVTDIGVDAVKIGMLGRAEAIAAVGRALSRLPAKVPIVLDPVMTAGSGTRLLDCDAERSLIELLANVTVVTPNLPEARTLAAADEQTSVADLARTIHGLGPAVVVITGGHRKRAVDLFYDGVEAIEIGGEHYPGGTAHGSGCTHSSVLAASLAQGMDPLAAARRAKQSTAEAIRSRLSEIGAGAGPVDVLGLRRRST